MDISALSIGISQSNVKVADLAQIKTTMDTGKENDDQMVEKIQNVATDPNMGQNLDVIASQQKDRNEELNRRQLQELKWAQEKQKMMSIKETKMLQMREIGDQVMQSKLTSQELKKLDDRLHNLAAQISAIDMDSKRTKDGKVKY